MRKIPRWTLVLALAMALFAILAMYTFLPHELPLAEVSRKPARPVITSVAPKERHTPDVQRRPRKDEQQRPREPDAIVTRKVMIAGCVVNEKQQPVAHATVQVQPPYSKPFESIQTDAEGTFLVPGLAAGTYLVSVQHGDYAPVEKLEVLAGGESLRITLRAWGAVEGNVVLPSGEPASEFEVSFFKGYLEYPIISRHTPMVRCVDPSGYFLLGEVDAMETTLLVRAEGCAATAHYLPKVGAGGTTQAGTIYLQQGTALDGLVLGPSNMPVGGADIFVGWVPSSARGPEREYVAATTDSQGRFHLASLSPGLARIYARHPHFAVASEEVVLEADTNAEVEIYLGEGGQIEGRITVDGTPGEGIVVNLSDTLSKRLLTQVRTDDHGYYRLLSVPLGDVSLSAHFSPGTSGQHYKRIQAVVEEGKVTVADFDFHLGTAEIVGRLTIDGSPPRNATAELTIEEEQVGTSLSANGEFRLDRLPEGDGQLILSNLHGWRQAIDVHTKKGEVTQVFLD